jgi:competence protein ComEC
VAGQSRAQGQVGTWPRPGIAGAAAPWRVPVAGLAGPLAAKLREWAAVEVAPGRLMPWLPVAFGTGIACYFTAAREPVWWVAAALAASVIVLAFFVRARASFPVVLGCAAVAAGFATAAIKARIVDHTVLRATAYSVEVSGFVESREERERSDRIVVRVTGIEGARLSERPERIRLTVRKGRAPAVGSFVAMKARINPPTSPLRPGGYDLARDLYFQGIGATGLVLGAITPAAPAAAPGWRLKFATAVEAIRDGIDARIRAAIPGDTGAIASALITGKRDALTGSVFDAMFISGVGHVLSVSGYHMALVAGVVFFILRAGLALVPGLALRRPVKKWAAAAALVAAACYLVLSGAEVATQRSFIMTAVVLVGVMADRPALTLRTIAVAALAVMLLAPEAVVHPSFQMSFAATLALIAAYERGIPWIAASADTSLGARVALWGVREAGFLMLASLVAGFATMPYAAYHFHRLAPYGVLANLLAMPVISALSMPAGLLALVAMPFGFDAPLWRLMGVGIDWMIMVATWVAHLPGAVGHVGAFGIGALLFATAGLIVLCLLRSPLRFAGAGLAAAGCIAAVMAAQPDVLISATGEVVAVRGHDGRLTVLKSGNNDALAVGDRLNADGDARPATDRALAQGFACDPDGCAGRLADGTIVAVARSPAALADDCSRAALVVTPRPPPPGCAAMVIDRRTLRGTGALALFRREWNFDVVAARPSELGRPWARRYAPGETRPALGSAARPAPDATPPPDADVQE